MAEGHDRCRGGACVELAILAPFLIVAMLGAIDFGRAVYDSIALNSAAEAGAQYGAKNRSYALHAAGIAEAVLDDIGSDAGGSIGDDSSQALKVEGERYCECSGGARVSCDGACSLGAEPIVHLRVRVEKRFEALFPYPGIPDVLVLARESHVRVN